MNKEFDPASWPAWPEDLQPCVHLETFSLAHLQKDDTEKARLLEVCKTRGFFYLSLHSTRHEDLPKISEELGALAEKVFKLPAEEKLRYGYAADGKISNGYKAVGLTVADAAGNRDTSEYFNISKDEMLGNTTNCEWPTLILQNRPVLAEYVRKAHECGLEIMSFLAQMLDLAPDTFKDKHRLGERSGDLVRLIRGPARKSPELPEIQTPGHTDFGTVTLLMNWIGGLQIWSEASRGNYQVVIDPESKSGTDEWLWVRPKPGHAIINLGDTAVKFTNKVLASARHRVVPAPGEQGLFPRYSIAYFVRPEDDCVLKQVRGGQIPDGPEEESYTGSEWIIRQAKSLCMVAATGEA